MWDLLLPVLLVSSLILNLLLLRAVVPPDVASPVTACFVIAERLRGAVSLLRGAGLVAAGARASPRRKSPVQLPRHMVPVRLEDDDEENPVCGGSLHDDRQSAAGPRRSRQNGGDGGHRALAAAATAAVFSDSHGPDEEERGSEIASDIARPRCSSNLWGVGGTSGTPGSAEAASSVDGSEEPGDAAGDAALATRKKQARQRHQRQSQQRRSRRGGDDADGGGSHAGDGAADGGEGGGRRRAEQRCVWHGSRRAPLQKPTPRRAPLPPQVQRIYHKVAGRVSLRVLHRRHAPLRPRDRGERAPRSSRDWTSHPPLALPSYDATREPFQPPPPPSLPVPPSTHLLAARALPRRRRHRPHSSRRPTDLRAAQVSIAPLSHGAATRPARAERRRRSREVWGRQSVNALAPSSVGGRPLGPSEEELAARAAVAAGERTRAAHAQRERVMAHMIALDEATGHAERDFD